MEKEFETESLNSGVDSGMNRIDTRWAEPWSDYVIIYKPITYVTVGSCHLGQQSHLLETFASRVAGKLSKP